MALQKYRAAHDVYELSFAPDLVCGETLSDPIVTVLLAQDSQWVDVTTDVVDVYAVNGQSVQFKLKPAVGTTQPSGSYEVNMRVTTSNGRVLVGKVDLRIS